MALPPPVVAELARLLRAKAGSGLALADLACSVRFTRGGRRVAVLATTRAALASTLDAIGSTALAADVRAPSTAAGFPVAVTDSAGTSLGLLPFSLAGGCDA